MGNPLGAGVRHLERLKGGAPARLVREIECSDRDSGQQSRKLGISQSGSGLRVEPTTLGDVTDIRLRIQSAPEERDPIFLVWS